jgi:hypothetical protein
LKFRVLFLLLLTAGIPTVSQEADKGAVGHTSPDRDAFTVTHWDLNIHIDPEQGLLESRGKVQLRNDSKSPQEVIALQISSSLRWAAVHVGNAPAEFSVTKIASDIDHTGSVNEAVFRLPQPLARGAVIEIEVGYAGLIPRNSGRLERVGTPVEIARRSDWDRITASFSGVRGMGYVAWYPVSMTPERLGDGNKLFEALGQWRARHAESSFHALYTVEHETLVANATRIIAGSEGKPAVVESTLARLGTETPFFVAAKFAAIETPRGHVFYLSGNEEVARQYADVLRTLDPPFAKSKVSSAESGSRKPLAREVANSSAVAVVQLPEDVGSFESGPVLLAPLRAMAASEIERLLIHTVAHGAFYSKRAWIYEGLAHYAQARLLEEQNGRKTAIDFMQQRRNALVIAEGGGEAAQSLVEASDEVFYRTKAMFVWWMLHDMVGDAALDKALTQYRAEQDKEPAYLQRLVEAAAGRQLEWFFDDWVYRDRGLPDFRITSLYPRQSLNGGFIVTVSVENLGGAGAELPVVVHSKLDDISGRLLVPAKDKAATRVELHQTPLNATVNDGSVPESDMNNNGFEVPVPASSTETPP